MPRKSTAKERLLDAALEMIWENSYGATSVDAICERSDVKKGSFYYFFKSKADLASAALEADWLKHQPELDAMFSPTIPPLERLQRYFDFTYRRLKQLQEQCGCVLGCPLYTLGSEVCTQENVLREKIQQILDRKLKYFESAIRDAVALGQIPQADAANAARTLFVFFQGALTQARIENNVEVLKELSTAALAHLGANHATAASS